MKKSKKIEDVRREAAARRRKATKAEPEARKPRYTSLIKRHLTMKHFMELLDDTFRHCKQKPPAMDLREANPISKFLIHSWDAISKWPELVVKEFLTDMYAGDMPPTHTERLRIVKNMVTEVFDARDAGPKYLARWRMWPHQRDKDEPAAKKEEDNLMANKLATKKKVTSIKRTVEQGDDKPAKKAKANGGGSPIGRSKIADDDRLVPGKGGPEKGIYGTLLPLIPKGGITLAALVKAAKGKKLDEKKARRYAAGAVREGYAKVA